VCGSGHGGLATLVACPPAPAPTQPRWQVQPGGCHQSSVCDHGPPAGLCMPLQYTPYGTTATYPPHCSQPGLAHEGAGPTTSPPGAPHWPVPPQATPAPWWLGQQGPAPHYKHGAAHNGAKAPRHWGPLGSPLAGMLGKQQGLGLAHHAMPPAYACRGGNHHTMPPTHRIWTKPTLGGTKVNLALACMEASVLAPCPLGLGRGGQQPTIGGTSHAQTPTKPLVPKC